MTQIDKIELKNFRGVRLELTLALPKGQSLLLYGDNGTGKSTFLDAIEWFITDGITHLSGEEIESHGGVRNALCADGDDCFVAVSFLKPDITNKKTLAEIKGKPKSAFVDAPSADFEALVNGLSRDRLWIRNKELVEFILGTKSDRLHDISSIIGFEPVSATKATLRKAANDIRTTVRSKGFEASINAEKGLIAEKLGAIVNTEEQFLKTSNELLATISSDIKLKTLQDLDATIKALSQGQESAQIQRYRLLLDAEATGTGLVPSVSTFELEINAYSALREKLKQDKARLKQVTLSKLLDEAAKILAQHEEDSCPLCLQLVSREELRELISKRIAELKHVQEEVASLDTTRKQVLSSANALVSTVEKWVKQLVPLGGGEHTDDLTALDNTVKALKEIAKDLLEAPLQQKLLHDASIYLTLAGLTKSLKIAAKTTSDVLGKEISDTRLEIVAKLSVAKASFQKVQRLLKESSILAAHQNTLDTLASEFTSRQREGMKDFLAAISISMNEYFIFMNSDEKVTDIELVCLDDKAGEFTGVAVNFRFHGQSVGSPRKLLSESHINCLGLCLFLATVREFNKQGKFVVLDDIISSFDKNHRILFARLLVTKFSDRQLIVLTHETEWYEFLASLVKAPAWRVLRTQWAADTGTRLTESSGTVRDQIDGKLKNGEEDGLGNLMRRYGERLLKEISQEIEAPFPFRFNERNEARTFDELYSAIRSQVRKHSNIADHDAVTGLATCQFFTNKTSHDNMYRPNLADLKVAMSDLDKFTALFLCTKCERLVGTRLHNVPEKKITCKCGTVAMQWK